MLNVVILTVIMLSVVTPCVVAPNRLRCHKSFLQNNLGFPEISWNVFLRQIFVSDRYYFYNLNSAIKVRYLLCFTGAKALLAKFRLR